MTEATGGREERTVVLQSSKESGRNEVCRKEQERRNSTLFKISTHITGRCDSCGHEDTAEHVVLHRQKYEAERSICFKTSER